MKTQLPAARALLLAAAAAASYRIDGGAGPTAMRIENNTVDQASDCRWAIGSGTTSC